MRGALALCLGAACGGAQPARLPAQGLPAPAAAEPAPPAAQAPPEQAPLGFPLLSIDWSSVSLKSDADALALWRQIAPTGADWTLRLGELPDDDRLLKRLAIALLREGNFTCPALLPCTNAGVEEVASSATLTDPCLRRELALWAFQRLDEDDAAELGDTLVAISGMPPPEHELVSEAFDLVPANHDDLLLRMNQAARAAGQAELADSSLPWLSPLALQKVLEQMHADGVYEHLDIDQARPSFLAAIADRRLKAKTSIAAMHELTGQSGQVAKDVRLALRKATADPRCEVAGAAIQLLEQHGEPRYLPRPARASTAAALHSLCVAAAYTQSHAGLDEVLRPFVSPQGLQVIDHAAASEDPSGGPQGEFIARSELVTLPFLEDLSAALESCSGSTCKTFGLRFELSFDAKHLLQRIERFAEDSPACASP